MHLHAPRHVCPSPAPCRCHHATFSWRTAAHTAQRDTASLDGQQQQQQQQQPEAGDRARPLRAQTISTPQHCTPPDSSAPAVAPLSPLSRRMALQSLAAAGGICAGRPRAADATVGLELTDGQQLTAWEFDVPLRVVALRGSVPGAWTSDFKAVAGQHARFAFEQRAQLADIYGELTGSRRRRKSAATADAVTLGDAWLAPAIQQGALQPIQTPERWRWWGLLPARWKRLVQRNEEGLLDPRGEVWGVPYRWGCTLVAYHRDRLDRVGHRIEDWSDLLQPALRRRIGIIESPREMMAITLRTLGLSPNATPAELRAAGVSERTLVDRLRQLRKQVLVASNQEAARALNAGDIWVLIGWSEELATLALRSSKIELVAPASGTTLWADMWTVPAGARAPQGPSPLLPLWFELAVQPARGRELNQLRKGVSPLLLPDENGFAPGVGGVAVSGSRLLGGFMPSDEVLARSEFMTPLTPETRAMYTRIIASL